MDSAFKRKTQESGQLCHQVENVAETSNLATKIPLAWTGCFQTIDLILSTTQDFETKAWNTD